MRPAARNKDQHICNFVKPAGPTPHIGGPLTTGARQVLVNAEEAAIYSDESECTGIGSPPPKDSIVGGNLMVFIGQNPAARMGEVTYGGSVVVGSSNVFHNAAAGPLSEVAANWLHQYLQQQKDIPFNFPWDGCYWRADRMREMMESQFGVSLKKIFVHGNLQPITGTLHDPFGRGPVGWGYHVAPMVEGVDASGNAVQWVVDPSMSPSTILTKDEWLDITKGSGSISRVNIENADAFAPSSSGGYSTDGSWADPVIEGYRDEVANGQYADGNADLSGKVASKESFARPVVRPAHVP